MTLTLCPRRTSRQADKAGFVLELSANTAILRALCHAARGWGRLGTAAQRYCDFAGDDRLQCAHDLSALYDGFLLEFFRGLRAGRRAIPRNSTRLDHGCGFVAEILGHP